MRLALRFDLELEGRTTLPKDWMHRRLERRAQREHESEMAVDRQKLGEHHVPSMYKRLVQQIRNDLDVYKERTGALIVIRSEAAGLVIEHTRFPTYFLALKQTRYGILAEFAGRLSSSAKMPDLESLEIFVYATAPDQAYYSIEGKRQTDESQAAEVILTPMLEFIES